MPLVLVYHSMEWLLRLLLRWHDIVNPEFQKGEIDEF